MLDLGRRRPVCDLCDGLTRAGGAEDAFHIRAQQPVRAAKAVGVGGPADDCLTGLTLTPSQSLEHNQG
ncbi:hypothetical protein WJX73_001628 [Symbiochloris irregularis]|uniref:Uncharacterized protein n=1 Tax=Symbiochloris irregularis TaxID=706552 RepID=A0AAW1PZ81_9CHLO